MMKVLTDKKPFVVYLAGDMLEWREEILNHFYDNEDIQFINPQNIESQNALGRFIADEFNCIKKADLVFAYIKEEGKSPSDYFGTTAEITFAFANNKSVLMVNERLNLHPFHLYMSKYVRTSLSSGIKALETLINTGNQFMADYSKP